MNLIQEFKSAIENSVKKVHIQCLQPFLYLNQGVLDRFGPSDVMIGMDADDLWGSGRKGAVAYHNGGGVAFREIRKKIFNDKSQSDFSIYNFISHGSFRKTGEDSTY